MWKIKSNTCITENKYFSRKNISVFEKRQTSFLKFVSGGDQRCISPPKCQAFLFFMWNNQILICDLFCYIIHDYNNIFWILVTSLKLSRFLSKFSLQFKFFQAFWLHSPLTLLLKYLTIFGRYCEGISGFINYTGICSFNQQDTKCFLHQSVWNNVYNTILFPMSF